MTGSATNSLIGLILAIVGVAVVIKIIGDAAKSKKYVCPDCGRTLRKGVLRCPECGTQLRWT